MTVLDLLATSQNRQDEQPNEDLADEIIRSGREDWVNELVQNLGHRDKNIQSDCIKVLYEIGEKGSPGMIASYTKDFGKLLLSSNNRLVWGAMTALDTIAPVNPKGVFDMLPQIIAATEKGSVITIDHGVGILAQLSCQKEYEETTFPLLMEQLRLCPAKQLPMYAEKSLKAISVINRKTFSDLILSRIPEMEKDSQKHRLIKVMNKIKNV